MSTCATNWAWRFGKDKITPTEKMVLLALADRANELHICYPSQKRLETDTLLNRKTIINCIKSLCDKGIISILDKKVGRLKRVNVYKLNGVVSREGANPFDEEGIIEDDSHSDCKKPSVQTTPSESNSTKNGTIIKTNNDNSDYNSPKNGTINKNCTENDDFNSPKNGTFNSPKNGIQNRSIESKNNIPPIVPLKGDDNGFSVFWDAWPKGYRIARASAEKIWKRKKYNLDDAEMMAKDILKRSQSCASWLSGHIPNPTTYLNQKRWNDDIRPRTLTTLEVSEQVKRQKQIEMRKQEEKERHERRKKYEQERQSMKKIEEEAKKRIDVFGMLKTSGVHLR